MNEMPLGLWVWLILLAIVVAIDTAVIIRDKIKDAQRRIAIIQQGIYTGTPKLDAGQFDAALAKAKEQAKELTFGITWPTPVDAAGRRIIARGADTYGRHAAERGDR